MLAQEREGERDSNSVVEDKERKRRHRGGWKGTTVGAGMVAVKEKREIAAAEQTTSGRAAIAKRQSTRGDEREGEEGRV